MPLSTLGVLSLLVVICLVAGVVAARHDANLGSWLFTAGLLGAAAWSGLGMIRAAGQSGGEAATTYLSLFAMAVAGTIYFLDRARRGLPPT